MFIYVYWPKDIDIPQQWQAFTDEPKAVEYVIKQISRYCSDEVQYCKDHNYKELPTELVKLQSTLQNKSVSNFDTAITAIKLYEEYMLYVRGIETPLHILKSIQTME